MSVGQRSRFIFSGFGLFSAFFEEVLDKGLALEREAVALYGDFVKEAGVVGDIESAAAATAFVVAEAEDDFGDSGVDDSAGAHGAGFFGDEEGAVGESPVFEFGGGLGDCEDFGVGGGVFEGFDLVEGSADNLVIVDDDGADGDFAGVVGVGGLFEGLGHVVVVGFEIKHG